MKTPMHRLLALPLAALFAVGAATHAASADYVDLRRIEPVKGDLAAGAAKAVVCFACHGPNGNAIVPTFPRLAGQHADYLYYRLREYKQANAKDPYYAASPMLVQAASLNDADMRNLAVYFAAQTSSPAPGAVAAAEGSAGNVLYMSGDPAHGIPPCQGCHGADATGPAERTAQYAAYPALRGQHAPYLIARLSNYRGGLPHYSSNDFIMHSVARTLDDGSIQAVAAWLSSLPPQPVH